MLTTLLLVGMISSVNAQLSGTYILDSEGSGDYTTLNDVITDLEADGVSGPVNIVIKEGAYGAVGNTFGTYLGTSSLNKVRFSSDPTNTLPVEIVALGTRDAMMTLTNASFLEFDGLTINANLSGTKRAIQIDRKTSGISISNCIITGTNISTTYDEEYCTISFNSEGREVQGVKFEGNTITGGARPIYFHGEPDIPMSGVNFTKNTISATLFGIYFENQIDLTFSENNVSFDVNDEDITTGHRALEFFNCNSTIKIERNTVTMVGQEGSAGIVLRDCSGSVDNHISIVNNMVSLTNSIVVDNRGIYILDSQNINLNFNTVSLNSPPPYPSENRPYSLFANRVDNLSMQNNIFANNVMGESLRFYQGTNIISDYNYLYTNGPQIVLINISGYADLSDYQANNSLSLGTNSLSGASPDFINPENDLHLDPLITSYHNSGIYITGIISDIDGEARNPLAIDMGADQIDEDPVANAGEDRSICEDATLLTGAKSANTTGVWTSSNSQVIIENSTSDETIISNLPLGQTIFTWTVTGATTVTDEVIITNNMVVADAGDDITLFSNTYPNHISSTYISIDYFNSSDETASWNSITPRDLTFSEIIFTESGVANTLVSDLIHGQNIVTWEISNTAGCSSVDTLSIFSGFQFIPADGVTELLWEEPTHWEGGVVPGITDSVSIFNCNATIDDITAECTSLNIGSGGTLTIKGAVSGGRLSSRSLVIEQNAERANEPKMFIRSGGTVQVGTTSYTAGGSLRIGRRGSLVIEQTAERSTLESTAHLRIGGNTCVTIGEEDDISAISAQLKIRRGGSLVIEQTAERASSNTIKILNGGYVEIGDTIPTTVMQAGATARILGGRSLVIEQTAERTGRRTGLRLGSGGSLVIEQTAERAVRDKRVQLVGFGTFFEIIDDAPAGDTRVRPSFRMIVNAGSAGGFAVGRIGTARSSENKSRLTMRGGSLVIEQTAERSANEEEYVGITLNEGALFEIYPPSAPSRAFIAEVHTPKITLNGGQVIIGGDEASNNPETAMVYTDFFEILPNYSDPQPFEYSAVIGAAGGFAVGRIRTARNNRSSWINMPEGSSFTVEEDAYLHFVNDGGISLEEGASFIDNNSNTVNGAIKQQFYMGNARNISTPFTTLSSDAFSMDAEINSWDETTPEWTEVSAGNIDVMKGYNVNYAIADYLSSTTGIFNSTSQSVDLTASSLLDINDRGWNLVGNPYPSSLDWETMDLTDLNKTAYVFDAVNKNYKLYRQGGLSINGGSQFIQPGNGFFVKANTDMTLFADNTNKAHYSVPATRTQNSMDNLTIMSVSANSLTAQTAVLFDDNATTEVDNQLDAFNKSTTDMFIDVPNLYTVSGNDINHLAINTLPILGNTAVIVPMNFECRTSGTYAVSLDQTNIDPSVTIQLKDLKEGTMQDLRSSATYSFNHDFNDAPERFEIHFGAGIVGVEDIKNENTSHNIYSQGTTIYVTSGNNSSSNISVYSIEGKLITSKVINSNGKIALPNASGIYLVKATAEAGTTTTKVYLFGN